MDIDFQINNETDYFLIKSFLYLQGEPTSRKKLAESFGKSIGAIKKSLTRLRAKNIFETDDSNVWVGNKRYLSITVKKNINLSLTFDVEEANKKLSSIDLALLRISILNLHTNNQNIKACDDNNIYSREIKWWMKKGLTEKKIDSFIHEYHISLSELQMYLSYCWFDLVVKKKEIKIPEVKFFESCLKDAGIYFKAKDYKPMYQIYSENLDKQLNIYMEFYKKDKEKNLNTEFYKILGKKDDSFEKLKEKIQKPAKNEGMLIKQIWWEFLVEKGFESNQYELKI